MAEELCKKFNKKYLKPFSSRHIGPRENEIAEMLVELGLTDLNQLIEKTVPGNILSSEELELDDALSEEEVLKELKFFSEKNKVYRSYLGMGFYNTFVPPVIQRNILENPAWYTPYTPYQAEISQGRLETLFNFQTIVAELTGTEVSNASLLDEATAAAEAMTFCLRLKEKKFKEKVFFVSETCHPQTISVVQTRAKPLGIQIIVGDPQKIDLFTPCFGYLIQYPDTNGLVIDPEDLCKKVHEKSSLLVIATDLLALTRLKAPGEFDADVVIGNTQRFGMPMGYGGPHAAFFATREAYKRQIPGRIVGQSVTQNGKKALRLALQTREQHIRRDKATSNICTAQVLPAIVSSMYAVFHGPSGLKGIGEKVHNQTLILSEALKKIGYELTSGPFFDTLKVLSGPKTREDIRKEALKKKINLRYFPDTTSLGISIDETTTSEDILDLINIFNPDELFSDFSNFDLEPKTVLPENLLRNSNFLQQEVFHRYQSELEITRYMNRLQSKDLALTDAMIPLGSCTMKLNATAEMYPITWHGFANIHPYVPDDQVNGYRILFQKLEKWLAEITGLAAISLQPNAGSQGEYSGLLAIKAYHKDNDEEERDICLIPGSAHGTNPASAIMVGLKVVSVNCDSGGNIDIDHLKKLAQENKEKLAAIMITYPSTHGVFEEKIKEICEIIHNHGGQVYLDGANMNALVGICRPGEFGIDVCHLNLHKTFAIPHGGGGPGMGPICVAPHLATFLPGHPLNCHATNGEKNSESVVGAISASFWGSPLILPISYAYIALMGAPGLAQATRVAILNANYIAKHLEPHFPILYKGKNGMVAHECIIDLRSFKKSSGIEVEDVAKRLMDFGFHAPTMSWPVAGTLMIEPTETESKEELDRFCEAMIAIRAEIQEIEEGKMDRESNPLKNAPHTAVVLTDDNWDRKYSRKQAGYPLNWLEERKYWPPVSRIHNAYGDRNLVCKCS
ncbi:aminomethyl-transferring glycine dehydrogenase [Candidatus Riflebacteria bacterium]